MCCGCRTSRSMGAFYLAAEAERIARWRGTGSAGDGFKVGIAWQGNPWGAPGDRGRSIPLAAFHPLLLYRGGTAGGSSACRRISDVEAARRSARRHDGRARSATTSTAGKDAFIDTAAVMSNLDLVITSDTAVANVAGALGRPGLDRAPARGRTGAEVSRRIHAVVIQARACSSSHAAATGTMCSPAWRRS